MIRATDTRRLLRIPSRVSKGAMIIEQSPDEIAAKLALMSDELGHSVLDIRERAIASLNFKLSNDLLTFKDVGSHSGVLRALLDWFGHEDSVPGDERALAMLRRIVEEEPTAAARLQNLGAEAALLEVTDGASRQLAAQIESLVEKIATGGADVAPQEPPSSPPGPDPETANVDVPEADEKDDAEEAAEEPPAEEAAEAEDSTEVEDLKQEDSKEDAPAEEEDAPADEEDAPADEEEETAEEDNAEAAAAAPDDDDPAFIRLDPALKDMFRKNPRLATAYWNIVRTHGLESESNRAAAVAADAAVVAAVGDSRTLETATRGGSLHLRRVAISPRDDARLLELSVRLRHADDPCLLTAALTEFTDCALKDLPPQALLQRPRCLWAVISLARAREGPTAAHNARRATRRGGSPIAPEAVRAAALAALRDFVVAIKGALGHANDGAHAVRLAPTTTSTDPDDVEDLLLGGARENSYPPPVPCSDDDDDDDDDDVPGRDPLHALPIAHLLAVSVVPLLAEPAVAGDALLVLQETLPLLELTPADRGDDADAAAVVDVEAVATRLGTYATAMERALATASAGASASGEDELLPTGECPAFFPALAMTAVMLAAAGADAAAIATRRGTIPARLVTRVETAAIDELLAAAVPGLRKVTLAALDVLGRPSSAAECAAAEAAERATHAAEVAARDDAAAAASRSPTDAARMTMEALPALDFIAEDESEPLAARLVATLLTATASATAAVPEGAESSAGADVFEERRRLGDGVEDARLATSELLRHVSPAARRGAYAALAAAAEIAMAAEAGGAAAAVSAAARAVMVGPAVTGEIVSGGLADPDTRLNAAKCLDAVACGFGGRAGKSESPLASAAARALLPWLPWLECDLDDDVVGPAASAAAAAAVRAAPVDAWTPLEPLLRGLFHHSERRRAAAATGLARAMGDAGVTVYPNPDPKAGEDAEGSDGEEGAADDAARAARVDPFGSVVRHADNKFAVDYGEVRASPLAASVFGGKDVGNLVEVMMTDTLGTSVRVVAGDQLSLCAADPSLHKVVCSREVLARLAGLSATALAPEAERVTNDVGVAALKVLATCVRHSREARVFFSEVARASPADVEQPYGRSSPVLPLVFHPRAAVREHLAVFCAYVVFGKVADLATTHAGLGLVPDPTAMHVPASIARQLRFPVPIRPMDAGALNRARLAASRASSPLEAEGTDRARVRAMLAQRREVRRLGGAAGVLATVERMLHEAGGEARTMGPVARVADATLRWASPASSAMVSLARLAHARSHDDATAACASLRGVLAFGPPGANAVLAVTWPKHAARLLHTPPRSPEDARLWASLASTLARAMRVATAPAPLDRLAWLAEAVKRAAVPVIRAVSVSGDDERFAPGFIASPETLRANAKPIVPPVSDPVTDPEERGEMAAASSAAAKAACELAARVLDAAVALSSAATYGGFVDSASDSASDSAFAAAAKVAGSILCETDLCEAVTETLVADARCEYGARVAAVECVASCARARALAAASSTEDEDSPLDDLADIVVEPLLTYCCTARIGADPTGPGARPSSAARMDARARIAEEMAGTAGSRWGALVDAGVDALDAVCDAAPGDAWSRAWASTGATFWLARLARDRRASRRASAWRLLSRASSPDARFTCALLATTWPEAPAAGAGVALDATEAPAVRAAACQFVAACLSTTAAADPLTLLEQPVPDVVPLLNDGEIWRGLAEVLVAAAGLEGARGGSHPYATADADGGTSGSEPAVTDPAAAAALRRGAAAALLACSRLSPVIVGVAMSPRRWADSNADSNYPDDASDAENDDNWPPALAAALRALDPAPWRTCLAAPPPEVLAWANPPARAAEDAAAAAANVAALVGAVAAANLENLEPSASDVENDRSARAVSAASRLFAAPRIACDTSAVPQMAATLAAAAGALVTRPPPRAGGSPSRLDAPRRASVCRAFARSASGLAAVLAAAADPGAGDAATNAAWQCVAAAPLSCALILDLAAAGASGSTHRSVVFGSAGAGLTVAATSACELLATLFRSPQASTIVVEAAARQGGMGGPVGARLATSLTRLWHAQAVGGERRWKTPGAAAAAAPHTAVSAALRNVLAYSASAKRAAADAELTATLLRVAARAHRIIAYERRAADAAAELERDLRGYPRTKPVPPPLPPAPRPLAMPADAVLGECVSLLKHVLYCSPSATAAAAEDDETMGAFASAATADRDGRSETASALGHAAAAARADAMAHGAMPAMHALWRHAVSDRHLCHELMGMAANLMAGNDDAKRMCVEDVDAGDGGKPISFAERMLRLAFRNTSPAATTRLALAPLAALAGQPDARRWLLRSRFLPKTMEQFAAAVGKRDAQRQVAAIRALADVAGGGGDDGRREVLRAGGGELMQLILEVLASAGVAGHRINDDEDDDIDVILKLPGLAADAPKNSVFQTQLPVAALEALLLLRNLCFHTEAKAHVTANPRALDALVAAAGASDPGARAAAADALLALTHNGQRITTLLRKGRRPARLRRFASRASKAVAAGTSGRARADEHAAKCLDVLVREVLRVGDAGDDAFGHSPDSTLLDISEADARGIGREPSDGLAIGPAWVH